MDSGHSFSSLNYSNRDELEHVQPPLLNQISSHVSPSLNYSLTSVIPATVSNQISNLLSPSTIYFDGDYDDYNLPLTSTIPASVSNQISNLLSPSTNYFHGDDYDHNLPLTPTIPASVSNQISNLLSPSTSYFDGDDYDHNLALTSTIPASVPNQISNLFYPSINYLNVNDYNHNLVMPANSFSPSMNYNQISHHVSPSLNSAIPASVSNQICNPFSPSFIYLNDSDLDYNPLLNDSNLPFNSVELDSYHVSSSFNSYNADDLDYNLPLTDQILHSFSPSVNYSNMDNLEHVLSPPLSSIVSPCDEIIYILICLRFSYDLKKSDMPSAAVSLALVNEISQKLSWFLSFHKIQVSLDEFLPCCSAWYPHDSFASLHEVQTLEIYKSTKSLIVLHMTNLTKHRFVQKAILSLFCWLKDIMANVTANIFNIENLFIKNYNSFTELPFDLQSWFSNMKDPINLDTFVMNRDLVKSFGNMKRLGELVILDIHSTTFKYLPWSITELKHLRYLAVLSKIRPDILPSKFNDFIFISKSKDIKQELKLPCFSVAGLQLNDRIDVSCNIQISGCNPHIQDGQMSTMILESDKEIVDCHHTFENEQNKNLESDTLKRKTLKKNVTRETIQQFWLKNMRLVDAADQLQVSKSTLKRRLKELNLKWVSSRKGKQIHQGKKRKLNSETDSKSNSFQQMVNSTNAINNDNMMEYTAEEHQSIGNVKKIVTTPQCSKDGDRPIEQQMGGTNGCKLSNTAQEDGNSDTFIVKATYAEDTVKFEFSLTSSMEQLRQEVGKRLELEVGTFKIKYQDDDNEWIRMSSASELEDLLHLSRSVGVNCVRLSVIGNDERSLNGVQKRSLSSQENCKQKIQKTKGKKFNENSNENHVPFHEDLVSCILPFIKRYTEVKGDGNCGFRTIAVFEYEDEEKWWKVKQDLKDELKTHKELYKKVLGSEEEFKKIWDIVNWVGTHATKKYWYDATWFGLVVATRYQKVCTNLSKECPTTFLPLEIRSVKQAPTKYINMALIRGDHFVALHMSTADIPLPPLMPQWEHHCNIEVKSWFKSHFKKQLDSFSSDVTCSKTIRGYTLTGSSS